MFGSVLFYYNYDNFFGFQHISYVWYSSHTTSQNGLDWLLYPHKAFSFPVQWRAKLLLCLIIFIIINIFVD